MKTKRCSCAYSTSPKAMCKDCGVFAIAFALQAALGQCVGDIAFDQSKMKNHLLECFKARKLTPFPTKCSC